MGRETLHTSALRNRPVLPEHIAAMRISFETETFHAETGVRQRLLHAAYTIEKTHHQESKDTGFHGLGAAVSKQMSGRKMRTGTLQARA